MKKKSILILSILLISISFTFAQKEDIPVLNQRVTDLTQTLTADEIQQLEQKLQIFEDTIGSQVVVLIVSTTGEESIEEYSLRVAQEWKIGRKDIDDGVILLIAKNDRTLRIEVGYGLEATITDAYANRIINEYIVPDFKNGSFFDGINNGVQQIIYLITGNSSFTNQFIAVDDKYNNEEIEEKQLIYNKYPDVIILLIMVSIFGIFLFIIIRKIKIYWIIILFVFLVSLNIFLGYAMGMYFVTFLFLPFTLIFGIVSIVAKLNPKAFSGKGGSYRSSPTYVKKSSGSTSYGSSSYSSSSSYGGSSSYSGGGGSFGGGGSSGSW